jgi:hypothetical protein
MMQMPNHRELAERLCSDLQEARDTVADWAAYASDYFQQKHHLAGELARIDRQIESARAALAAEQQGPSDDDLRGIFYQHSDSGDDGPAWIESEQFIVAARAVLARYGAQP